jgi:hypothetical protein
MSDQPEVLRLADALESKAINGPGSALELGAASELRRLHAENDALRDALRLIENTDPLDASLDSGWVARVARVALEECK